VLSGILLKYDKTKCIDNKDRNHLCDIIICHFLNEGKRLNNATISILADKIVEIFQAEKRSTYFVSPIGKNRSHHNRPEVATGKLIDKHRNKLSMLKKTLKGSEGSEIVKKKKGKFKLYYTITFLQEIIYMFTLFIISDISEEMKDSRIWLIPYGYG